MLGKLFFTFARIGASTFGGGYAMLPMLQREVVEKFQWATEDELMDYYVIGQCTPGIIAINTATFVGGKQAGFPGAFTATFGLIFPSYVIITIIAAFLQQFTHLAVVSHAFGGIRVAVCALVLNAVIGFAKKGVTDKVRALILAIAFLLTALTDLSPVLIVLGGGIFGCLWQSSRARKEGD